MKINLNKIDTNNFTIRQLNIYGEELILVQPNHIGTKWTKENLIFRSSIWNVNGELVSASFPKFFNWNENLEISPIPSTLYNCIITEKLDGSLLIVSKYKNNLILRTRGTFDAKEHLNGIELEIFKQKYINVLEYSKQDTWNYSWLFEWTSEKRKIILDYGKQPNWTLVGIVNHTDYSLLTQKTLDQIGQLFNLKRPESYSFNKFNTEKLLSTIAQWEGKEGVCVYSNDGQSIWKIKSDWYLKLHKMKSQINNKENLVELYVDWKMPSYEEFKEKIIISFDYELFSQIEEDIKNIAFAKEDLDNLFDLMETYVSLLKLSPRKEAAMSIMETYSNVLQRKIAFLFLDSRPISNQLWKALILQRITASNKD
jgi:hypothetical protein